MGDIRQYNVIVSFIIHDDKTSGEVPFHASELKVVNWNLGHFLSSSGKDCLKAETRSPALTLW